MSAQHKSIFPQTVYCWGSILERKELATLTGPAPDLCGWALWLGSVAGLCGWALSSSCPPLGRAPELCQLCGCGWALSSCPPLGRAPELCQLCGWALSSSCPPLGRAPELCQLCGWALWLGFVAVLCGWALSSSCPPLARAPELCQPCGWTLWLGLWLGLVLLLSYSWPRPSTLSTLWLGSVAGLCGWALSSSCPPLGRAKELCQLGFAAVLCALVLLLSSSWPSVAGLCGWALCPGLVLLLSSLNSVNSVAGLCGWALCPGLVLLNSVNSEKEKKERKKDRKKERKTERKKERKRQKERKKAR